jgi:hypothetical protein
VSFESYVAIGAGAFLGLILLGLLIWKFPRRAKKSYYVKRWKKLQKLCADKEQWPRAVIEADDLLNDALKKKRFRGKNMGERLVEAQKDFTDNDSVWFGHKLRAKIETNPDLKLRKEDVQKALLGLGQAMKDIGVL